MPYSKSELGNIEFYKTFIDRLRFGYLKEVKEFAEIGFRKNNILYSFEDIINGLGIDYAPLGDNNDNLYLGYMTKGQQEISKTVNKENYPIYIKSSTLEKVVDRTFSELDTSEFADTLPDSIVEGDVITNEDPEDFRRWLLETNQKRLFPDLAIYYGRGYLLSEIKTLPQREIDSIPDGEEVE
tara:strand:+ start:4522 stop:5070 length:549 start_codon:yes stop_codon:yes gene_type:complete